MADLVDLFGSLSHWASDTPHEHNFSKETGELLSSVQGGDQHVLKIR